jgi:hypothetical protein
MATVAMICCHYQYYYLYSIIHKLTHDGPVDILFKQHQGLLPATVLTGHNKFTTMRRFSLDVGLSSDHRSRAPQLAIPVGLALSGSRNNREERTTALTPQLWLIHHNPRVGV